MKKNLLKIVLVTSLFLFLGCSNNSGTTDKVNINTKENLTLTDYNSNHDYILGQRYITDTAGSNKKIIDWCLGTQVWREFGNGRRGSMSQIIVIETGTSHSSIPYLGLGSLITR